MQKEFYYIMGYLWADGYFKRKDNTIILEIVSDDAYEIFKHFKTCHNKWYIFDRKLDNRKDAKRRGNSFICITDKKLKQFFIELGYTNREEGLGKVLNYIPNEYFYLFIRGLSDGDGCIYINKSIGLNQYHISSSHDTDWLALKNKISELTNVSFNESKRVQNEKSKSSKIQICAKKDLYNFLNYMYKKDIDIGLQRKYNKYIEFLN